MKGLASDGFEIDNEFLQGYMTESFLKAIESDFAESLTANKGGVRFPHRKSKRINELLESTPIKRLVTERCGEGAFLIKSVLFDKNKESNWLVPWHQDLTIAVKEKLDVEGFGPWSTKDDVLHTKAPQKVLSEILTIRIHLDECSAENGALKVIPGSHQLGRLKNEALCRIAESQEPFTCEMQRGGVLLMKPLTIHASSPSAKPSRRRVLHLEYSASELPGGLQWHA